MMNSSPQLDTTHKVNRRQFLLASSTALIGQSWASADVSSEKSAIHPPITQPQAGKPLNVILFLTDDHGAWAAGCYGNKELQTPHLDRLAQEGIRFSDATTPCPVCSPGRACIMTGQTPSQIGIHDWLNENNPIIANHPWLADQSTLPKLFQQAGYHTMLTGKWHLGGSHTTPDGFDQCFGLPYTQGWHNGEYTYHLNGKPVTLSGNKSQFITDHAIQFLRDCPKNQPFFLNVGYIATHSPYHQDHHDPKLIDQYKDASFSDLPVYKEHPWSKNEAFKTTEDDLEGIKEYRRGYYAAVTEIDNNIGRILAYLEETNQLDNTIIVYTSDHGCTQGHHGFWGKGNSTRPLNAYEHSIRIPLLIRHPQKESNLISDRAVDHYDTFATICHYADLRLPASKNYPGQSFAENPAETRSTPRFGEYGDLRFIRTDQYKLILRYDHVPNELFDLKNDPDETTNHYDNPTYQQTIKQLTLQLNTWYSAYQSPERTGLKVKSLLKHNHDEAWRDGKRENYVRGIRKRIERRNKQKL
ncbi:sulfatase family protein [Poriferisphaera sp. WC338]|uniref:sulfatase family protein n=1 Tax=Poriferisphaera sp. WC338 TaxID=3425129 RepID=UPI003D813138